MNQSVFQKTYFRRPIHVGLLFLLMTLLSFTFITRGLEYTIVKNELERVGGALRSIGMLTGTNSYDVTSGAEVISSSAYVASEDHRRAVSAMLQGMKNGDIGGAYIDTAFTSGHEEVWFTGQVVSVEFLEEDQEGGGIYVIKVLIETLLAGYPEYAAEGNLVTVYGEVADGEEQVEQLASLKANDRILFRTGFYLDAPIVPDRVRNDRENWLYAKDFLSLKPLDGSDKWYVLLEANQEPDWGSEEYADLGEELESVRSNQQAVSLLATTDMGAIPWLQEAYRDYYLVEGRYLTHADDIEARNVCVIHEEFAALRGLSVGDIFTVTVRDIGKILHFGYVVEDGMFGSHWPEDNKRDWRDLPTCELALEIVGTYGRSPTGSVSGNPTGYNTNIFIPNAILPEYYAQGDLVDAGTYSFVLKTSRDQDAFAAEYTALLKTMGIRLDFVPNSAETYWTAADQINRSLMVNFLLSAMAAMAGLLLGVFVYLRILGQEIAIARALGASVYATGRRVLYPGALISFFGITVGGIFSWDYAVEQASRTLSDNMTSLGATSAVTASPIWLIVLCACLFTLFCSLLCAGAWYISQRPVLGLLQRTQVRGRQGTNRTPLVIDTPNPTMTMGMPASTAPAVSLTGKEMPAIRRKEHQKSSMAPSLRFIWRQMCRSIFKSVLVIAVTAVLVLVLSRMSGTIADSLEEMDRLARAIAVDFEIIEQNPLSSWGGNLGVRQYGANSHKTKRLVELILDSGYIKEAELYSGLVIDHLVPVDTPSGQSGIIRAVGLTDPEAFLTYFHLDQEMTIEYGQGWGGELFSVDWMDGTALVDIPLVLPTDFAETYGIQLGDRLSGTFSDKNQPHLDATVEFIVAGYLEGDNDFEEALLPLSAIEAIQALIFAFHDDKHFLIVSMAGFDVEAERLSGEMAYTVTNFTIDPQFNMNLSGFQEQLDEWLADPAIVGEPALRAVFRDEEVRLALEPLELTIELMQVLLPVVTAAFVLVMAGLSAILLLLSAKEAAYLRMLGVPKGRVRWMLCLQQVWLCLCGLAVGIIASMVIQGSMTAVSVVPILFSTALLLMGTLVGAYIGAIFITRQKTMVLLQEKE